MLPVECVSLNIYRTLFLLLEMFHPRNSSSRSVFVLRSKIHGLKGLFCFCEVIYTVLMLNIIETWPIQCSYQNHDFCGFFLAKSFMYQVNDKTYNQKIRGAFTLSL